MENQLNIGAATYKLLSYRAGPKAVKRLEGVEVVKMLHNYVTLQLQRLRRDQGRSPEQHHRHESYAVNVFQMILSLPATSSKTRWVRIRALPCSAVRKPI
jgi:hypothetical protein